MGVGPRFKRLLTIILTASTLWVTLLTVSLYHGKRDITDALCAGPVIAISILLGWWLNQYIFAIWKTNKLDEKVSRSELQKDIESAVGYLKSHGIDISKTVVKPSE
eukprot:GHVH01008560.1.p1 GENE.GHVH01008560.1~~GHVH01008560.1.p1  ORF type:complete len:106 (+),score=12.70 GHVH01008560.1:61-378(+)